MLSVARTSAARASALRACRPCSSVPLRVSHAAGVSHLRTNSCPASAVRFIATASSSIHDSIHHCTFVSHASAEKIPPAEPWRRHISQDPHTPTVYTFFEKATSTWQYIVVDPESLEALVIDPVLDYEASSGTISTETADGLISFIENNDLTVTRILETHAHADHLTAAQYFKQQLDGDVPVCIGQRITQVQKTFAPIYGLEPESLKNTFDVLFKDEAEFKLGELSCRVMHLPGHTPDHVGFIVGKAVFTGDSIFNPDVGSARADFPGGNAEELYASMQRLLALPAEYRLYVGHDYPENRDQTCFSTVADQRERNKHVKQGSDQESFIKWRKDRDAVLGAPRLLHPSLQVNIRAGKLPPADTTGRVYLKIPVRVDLEL
ncbi:Glyoxylase B2 [Grifola frondosa]|uniref:Glyoxylase B2 n=1 Tax=Grifola frondosa TaxID=5627 RepID=A0A1C7LTP1_GRIFR|nr:Glyoxylase B2 [Grifola frondosa]